MSYVVNPNQHLSAMRTHFYKRNALNSASCATFLILICSAIVLAARCPALDEMRLAALKIDYYWNPTWHFSSTYNPRPEGYVKAYHLFCADFGQYRVPREVLTKTGASLLVQQLDTNNTDENRIFWTSQKMKCLLNTLTGVPEWDWDALVACEPRTCELTQELLDAVYLDIRGYIYSDEISKFQIWLGPPNVTTGMPLIIPHKTHVYFTCNSGHVAHAYCGCDLFTPNMYFDGHCAGQKNSINLPKQLFTCSDSAIYKSHLIHIFLCLLIAFCRNPRETNKPNTANCFFQEFGSKETASRSWMQHGGALTRPESLDELLWLAANYKSYANPGFWLGYTSLDGIRLYSVS